jgi:hypothetical protein
MAMAERNPAAAPVTGAAPAPVTGAASATVAGTAATIGEELLVRGFALAGVQVLPAEEPAAVRDAWLRLPGEVALVILTPAAAAALAGQDRGHRLVAVLPRATAVDP